MAEMCPHQMRVGPTLRRGLSQLVRWVRREAGRWRMGRGGLSSHRAVAASEALPLAGGAAAEEVWRAHLLLRPAMRLW